MVERVYTGDQFRQLGDQVSAISRRLTGELEGYPADLAGGTIRDSLIESDVANLEVVQQLLDRLGNLPGGERFIQWTLPSGGAIELQVPSLVREVGEQENG